MGFEPFSILIIPGKLQLTCSVKRAIPNIYLRMQGYSNTSDIAPPVLGELSDTIYSAVIYKSIYYSTRDPLTNPVGYKCIAVWMKVDNNETIIQTREVSLYCKSQ